jgi:hypothetical protein
MNTKELLELALETHGGIEKYNQFKILKAHLQIGGITWGMKGHDGALNNAHYTAYLHEQKGSWSGIFEPDTRSEFTPQRVALLSGEGALIEELQAPRESFKGHNIETPWTKLQTVYFSSYATWNYLTAPFNFLTPEVAFNELAPLDVNGGTLRRLEVIYPDGFATHSKRQVYYYDETGLPKRHDYWPEVLGGSSATQILEDYKDFSGIKLATKRRIYILNDADNSYLPEPVLVSIDLLDAKFE